jgi:30S ribosomal protein S31
MGKGDQRSRRGKIYRGSFGKSRPKKNEAAAAPAPAATRPGAARPAGRTGRK